MDYYTILAQKLLLNQKITGQRIEASCLHGKNLYLGFESETALKLACIPDMPYLLSIDRRYIPVRKSNNWFISRFHGNRLTEISLTPGDRVLTFFLDSGTRLVFEMTGRHANLVLLDNNGIIIGAVRKVGTRQSGYREIRTGIQYCPPPARDFTDPLWAPLPVLDRKLKETNGNISDALAVSICSGSRLCAREALARAEIALGIRASDIDERDTLRLLKTTAEMVDCIEKGGDGGTVIYGDDELPRDVFPLPMIKSNQSDKYFNNLNDAVKKYSHDREITLEKRNLTKTITNALSHEERSIRTTIIKIVRERGKQSEPEILERKGNTILANLHLIHKGLISEYFPDPYGSGTVEIELDPTRDGPSNAKRYFNRARKFRTAAQRADKRIASLKNHLDEISAESKSIKAIDNISELRKIAANYARKTISHRIYNSDQPFPRRFLSVSGLEIIVGRNNKENDELISWVRKNDFWLHAQGVAGSHVIVRSSGKNQHPDRATVEQAASIAAYYSKAMKSAVVPVVCTQVKYVVKRKGQGPGQVTYTREKVIFAEPGLPKRGIIEVE